MNSSVVRYGQNELKLGPESNDSFEQVAAREIAEEEKINEILARAYNAFFEILDDLQASDHSYKRLISVGMSIN